MANREWVYAEPSWNRRGVTLTDSRIEWWEEGQSFAGGAWCEQSFEHYLENGPWVDGVPANVISELTEAVRAKFSDMGKTSERPPQPDKSLL